MKELLNEVELANVHFATKFKNLKEVGISKDQYVRYLQMQYHLTKGVQRTFLAIASHSETRKYRKLRPFLVNFGYEEEMHYKLAESDLAELGQEPSTIPFSVELWWSYQRQVIKTKPIERLGATAVLENIGNYAAPEIKEVLSSSTFLNKKNTTFVNVHMHEELPHGDQILDALSAENFTKEHSEQLVEGAKRAKWLYSSTIFDWILNGKLTYL